MILQAVRSAIFYLFFAVVTLVLATVATLGVLVPPLSRRIAHGCAFYWTRIVSFLLWVIVGIRSEVTGQENIPEGACIIASKHQSDWDTVALYPELAHPAFIAKVELLKIPLVGITMREMGTIFLNRKKRGGAIASLIEQGEKTLSAGGRIFIFPEGTRRLPLGKTDYRFGVAKLYDALNVSVVPVALNSGLFWGRNSLILWPGTAKATFLPPIPPGLGEKEMHRQMATAIEKESTRLILEAVDRGLTRPIDPEFRERIKLAKTALGQETP